MADTTARIKDSTMERLKNLGKFGESVDDVINRILDEKGAEKLINKGGCCS